MLVKLLCSRYSS